MLWGGRFRSAPHPDLLSLTASIDVDIRLLADDLAATAAHARALARARLLNEAAATEIGDACQGILLDFRSGRLSPGAGDEDVHSLVERELTERLGETGARVHAGRSRNDLVATDLRLWCRRRAGELAGACADLVDDLAAIAQAHVDSVMPGYTHLQRGQPVSLGFHLAAHGFPVLRDGERFAAAQHSADVSALGAGALAGTTLPLDPVATGSDLAFASVFDNAMDAVSDRDFAVDLIYAGAMCGVHLSRFAEDVVLWTSDEFGFARLADDWSTGSSMMPQKRNPDLAELIRGRAAPTIGELSAALALLKGLPLAYDRDLQEDKALVFSASDRALSCLHAASALIRTLSFDPDRMLGAAGASATWATDLAEALVGRGVPFRDAHRAAGQVVADLESTGHSLREAGEGRLKRHHPALQEGDRDLDDARRSMASRGSHGGTAPERVEEQIAALRARASALRASIRMIAKQD